MPYSHLRIEYHTFHQINGLTTTKVEPPKTNNKYKTNTMYHIHTLGASKCMHVVHSVGLRSLLVLGGSTLPHLIPTFTLIF